MDRNIRKVLIVDDEVDFVLSLQDILETYGYIVEKAHDQLSATKKIDLFDANVVLLDVRLGRDNGLNLITILKETRPGIIPVIMTAYAEADSAIEAFQEGAYDYLRKPLSPQHLLKTLERCFDRIQLEKDKSKAQEALGKRNRELEEINAKLRESEERYRLLVETMNDGLAVQDQEGEITYVNDKFSKIIGYTKDELKGRKFCDYLDEINTEICMKNREKYLEKDITPFELTWTKKDNTPLPTIVSPQSMFDSTGEFKGIFSVITDITERKSAETERRNMEKQLQQAQKMESIGTLAGGISHDFNNSLQAIIGYAQILLLDKDINSSEYAKLANIEKSAQRASELTQQLLTFSRKVDSKMKPVDLNHEIKEIRKLLDRTIPKMIGIQLRLKKDLHVIDADPSQLEQIMLNLGINARDAIKDEGEIVIRTENVYLDDNYCKNQLECTPGDYVLLSFSDNGTGMLPEHRERIFDPFFTTKDIGKGTGLGLSMVYGLVKKHKGHIVCESIQGRGTVFKLYFPAVRQNVTKEENEEKPMPPGGHETILIVDDEMLIRELGEQILRKFGYKVLAAPDGESAIEIYREKGKDISLIILDLIMPGMGGTRCLQELLAVNPDINIVIASGYAPEAEAKKAMNSGAKGFINKPYDVRQMLSEIRDVIDGRKHGTGTIAQE